MSEGAYYFDQDAACRVIDFHQELLTHSKGEFAGRRFLLEGWQKEILANAFGWKRKEDGTRRYRKLYLEVPRKNGKSTLCAGIANYLTFGDQESGAEVYSLAGDRAQASIVFSEAKSMVVAEPILMERAEVYRKAIVVPETLSSYKVLSADADTKHGLNISGGVFDELHVQPDRHLYDVVNTAVGSRRQPMVAYITTAGYDRESICWEVHEHARKVISGEVTDEEFLAYIYAADEKDDWHSIDTWKKANPNYGVSLKGSFIEQMHREACLLPGFENTFKRLHLNIWTSQDTRWMRMDAWDKCAAPPRPTAGRKCWLGLDLSKRTDITARVAVFKDEDGSIDIDCRFWVPEDGLEDKARRDGVDYPLWARQGLVIPTPGNVIDYSFIRKDIQDFGRAHEVVEIAYDPWGATQLALQLQDDGFTCVEFMQGFKSMSEPTKKLEEIVLRKIIRHGGHPVLRWMADNAAVEMDAAGNLKLSKKKSKKRIDGLIALIMGLGRATLGGDPTSVYETRGLRTL